MPGPAPTGAWLAVASVQSRAYAWLKGDEAGAGWLDVGWTAVDAWPACGGVVVLALREDGARIVVVDARDAGRLTEVLPVEPGRLVAVDSPTGRIAVIDPETGELRVASCEDRGPAWVDAPTQSSRRPATSPGSVAEQHSAWMRGPDHVGWTRTAEDGAVVHHEITGGTHTTRPGVTVPGGRSVGEVRIDRGIPLEVVRIRGVRCGMNVLEGVGPPGRFYTAGFGSHGSAPVEMVGGSIFPLGASESGEVCVGPNAPRPLFPSRFRVPSCEGYVSIDGGAVTSVSMVEARMEIRWGSPGQLFSVYAQRPGDPVREDALRDPVPVEPYPGRLPACSPGGAR